MADGGPLGFDLVGEGEGRMLFVHLCEDLCEDEEFRPRPEFEG